MTDSTDNGTPSAADPHPRKRVAVAGTEIAYVDGNCGGPNNPWLCLADSAVYGTTDELVDRYGEAVVDSIRDLSWTGRLDAAHAWVDAAPQSSRARGELVRLLIARDQIAEVRPQLAAIRASRPGVPRA